MLKAEWWFGDGNGIHGGILLCTGNFRAGPGRVVGLSAWGKPCWVSIWQLLRKPWLGTWDSG